MSSRTAGQSADAMMTPLAAAHSSAGRQPIANVSGGSAAPAPADVSKTTIGGQPMLPSGARFDTTIIPLSTTQFVVVQDGGGSEKF